MPGGSMRSVTTSFPKADISRLLSRNLPSNCAAVRDVNYEIGLHGYTHENPVGTIFKQQRNVIDKTHTHYSASSAASSCTALLYFGGRYGKGDVKLLLRYGMKYDHSRPHEDHKCYWLRTDDEWTEDYTKKSEKSMKPIVEE
jgi:hypothetical protein